MGCLLVSTDGFMLGSLVVSVFKMGCLVLGVSNSVMHGSLVLGLLDKRLEVQVSVSDVAMERLVVELVIFVVAA